MKLRKIYIPKRGAAGFTLIEVILVMAMVGLLPLLGLAISLNSYYWYNFHAEQILMQNLLQKARSQALSNIDQMPHGVHVGGSSYTLYEGVSWSSRNFHKDISFPQGPGIIASGTDDIIFSALEGSCIAPGSIIISLKNLRVIFSVNHLGQINTGQ